MPTLVFWIDVDNTLLNNDEVKRSQDEFLQALIGPELAARYWNSYEEVRKERGLVDIPRTLERFRAQTSFTELADVTYLHMKSMFENYPFPQALYPGALETLSYLGTLGTTVVVSDGDLQYQAEKIFESNIADIVEGRVLLYAHKQEHLAEIAQRYPADHAVSIDDKPAILLDMKNLLGDKVTTVFVRQGKYAAEQLPEGFTPDITVDHIADLQHISSSEFLGQK
jgi:hypothetical protein